jgi:hypothetical protein
MTLHCKIFVGDDEISIDGWFAALPRVGEKVTLAGTEQKLEVAEVRHRVATSEADGALVAIYLIPRDTSLL